MNKPYYISGSRIYLREVKLDDVNENYYSWLNDPEVNQYLETRFIPRSMENIKEYVAKLSGDQDSVFLAVCLKKSDEHIGNIKLGPVNRIHRFADISLFIGVKKYWGNNYATDAITALTDFAFNQLNLHKVKAGCYKDNIGSQRAFEKAGFTREGILKKLFFSNGKYVDELIFGLLKDEWQKIQD